jgi:hypothetical protein
VWPEFERVRPFVLGSLLDAVSYSMGNVGSVRLDQKPRMADFSLWATAAEESFGLERGAFISAFMGNRESANALALEASPIAATLVELVEQRGAWKGSASDLLEALNQRASDETKKQQGWPKRPNSLSGALKRIAPNLRAAGIECNMGRTKAGSYRGKSSSTPSPASPSAESAFTVESEDDGRGDDAEYDARS